MLEQRCARLVLRWRTPLVMQYSARVGVRTRQKGLERASGGVAAGLDRDSPLRGVLRVASASSSRLDSASERTQALLPRTQLTVSLTLPPAQLVPRERDPPGARHTTAPGAAYAPLARPLLAPCGLRSASRAL